jgi:hypothetical protein
MVGHADGTVVFFQAMAPVLIANVLTVTFVYCFAEIHQKELAQGGKVASLISG